MLYAEKLKTEVSGLYVSGNSNLVLKKSGLTMLSPSTIITLLVFDSSAHFLCAVSEPVTPWFVD
jgi:hypothetical protein